jgi:hypothetical protein
MDSLREKLDRIMGSPRFARNLRGRLAAALRLLSDDALKTLACDYAEHVTWICEEVLPGEQRFRRAIAVTRGFLRGNEQIEAVEEARIALFGCELRRRGHLGRTASEALLAICLAVLVCCQRELEKLGVMHRNRYHPQLDAVASQANHAVAQWAAGEDWYSDDPERKAVAKARGKAAADLEVNWQIAQLLDRVGPRESSNA